MMELVLMIGLQASGKSTFARERFAATHVYVSMDKLRNNKRPARRQLQLIEEALQAGQSVVVDNTNPSVEVRAPLIALGQQYGAHITGYFFVPQIRRSLEWNKSRSGKECVPPVAIYATAKRLIPPTYEEGFTTLYQVEPGEHYDHAVLPWLPISS